MGERTAPANTNREDTNMTDNTTKNDFERAEETRLKAAARSTTAGRLRDNHREEYDRILQEEMSERGIDWKPRPSKRDKARQTIDRLLDEHPDLKDEVAHD